MEFETIIYEKKDGIASITLNRPERLNAINSVMSRELPRAWSDIKQDPNVTVVILTGSGDRALCTGVDTFEMSTGHMTVGTEEDQGSLQSIKFTALQNRCWKPVITAVNGMVVGGGLHFIADSDLIICADHATFFDTHVKIGLVSGHEPIGLARRMPLEAVLRMSLLGGSERMTAQRAYQIGMVSEVLPSRNLVPRAIELAQQIMENSPAALVASKRAIWESLNYGLSQATELGWSFIAAHRGHPDVMEGARAFMQKRKPQWRPVSLRDEE